MAQRGCDAPIAGDRAAQRAGRSAARRAAAQRKGARPMALPGMTGFLGMVLRMMNGPDAMLAIILKWTVCSSGGEATNRLSAAPCRAGPAGVA